LKGLGGFRMNNEELIKENLLLREENEKLNIFNVRSQKKL